MYPKNLILSDPSHWSLGHFFSNKNSTNFLVHNVSAVYIRKKWFRDVLTSRFLEQSCFFFRTCSLVFLTNQEFRPTELHLTDKDFSKSLFFFTSGLRYSVRNEKQTKPTSCPLYLCFPFVSVPQFTCQLLHIVSLLHRNGTRICCGLAWCEWRSINQSNQLLVHFIFCDSERSTLT